MPASMPASMPWRDHDGANAMTAFQAFRFATHMCLPLLERY
jgi:hypothetical protein